MSDSEQIGGDFRVEELKFHFQQIQRYLFLLDGKTENPKQIAIVGQVTDKVSRLQKTDLKELREAFK